MRFGDGMVAKALVPRYGAEWQKACCDRDSWAPPRSPQQAVSFTGVSPSSSELATLALLRGRRTCDHNHFKSLSPTFFSKEINILLFLCILVFSHSSSSVFSDAPGCGRGALLCRGTETWPNGSLPLPGVSDHALAGQQVVRRDEGTPHDFLGGPEATLSPFY